MTEIEDHRDFDVALRDVFVSPFYMDLLHANFVGKEDSDGLAVRISEAARAISDKQIERLLAERQWRGRLCVGWFAGLTRRHDFVSPIADLLLASAQVYAGQGYCVALGLIGTADCAQHLRSYLRRYLPLDGRLYDQGWALGALAHIEGNVSPELLEPKLWSEGDQSIDPAEAVHRSKEIFDYLKHHHMISEG
jgi:hypothetical protein